MADTFCDATADVIVDVDDADAWVVDEVASEVASEKLSVARVFDSLVVVHPEITKQQSVNSAHSLRVTRNLLCIDEVFLDVCACVKLC